MAREPQEEKPAIIRSPLWRAESVIGLGIVLGLCLVLIVFEPGAYPMLFILPFLLLMMWLLGRLVQVQITESTVRIQQMKAGYLEAPRSEIWEIHYYKGGGIVFRGAEGRSLMEPRPQWPAKQMREVAEVLGVPFYDHRPGRLPAVKLSP